MTKRPIIAAAVLFLSALWIASPNASSSSAIAAETTPTPSNKSTNSSANNEQPKDQSTLWSDILRLTYSGAFDQAAEKLDAAI
ncbi:MAG: hypothetical protein FWC56_02950, partial [Phycisphaerae bacterium]|nr:hypothetical protein [Phycisphaerae bacterium]